MIVASSNAERIDAALERLPASAEGYTVDVRREEQIAISSADWAALTISPSPLVRR